MPRGAEDGECGGKRPVSLTQSGATLLSLASNARALANVLCIGGKIIGPVLAMAIAKTWMATEPLAAGRYASRRRKVAAIDEERTVAL